MASYLILGAGKFGRLALSRLGSQDRAARFLVVDHQPTALAAARATASVSGVTAAATLESEAVSYLASHLTAEFPWDWLIPMVPVHVAWHWLITGPLAGKGWLPAEVPRDLGDIAAASASGSRGELYLSQARHRCPDDCAEPDACPVTGEERQQPLFLRLQGASRPGRPVLVVVSRQLAPGVGGYPPLELVKLAETVTAAPGPVLVATACRCHGVVHGLGRQGEPAA